MEGVCKKPTCNITASKDAVIRSGKEHNEVEVEGNGGNRLVWISNSGRRMVGKSLVGFFGLQGMVSGAGIEAYMIQKAT